MNARTATFTHTWTNTRLETIQEQFHKLLLYGGIRPAAIDRLLTAVANNHVTAIAVFGTDASKKRVVEVVLQVDWDVSARLTLVTPNLESGLPGWQDGEAPEIRVAGYRFAEVVKALELKTSFWVRFTPEIIANETLHRELADRYGVAFRSNVPDWKSEPEQRTDGLIDLPELNIAMRRISEP